MDKNEMIYGTRAVMEAIQAEKPIDKIFIQRGLHGNLSRELEQMIRKEGISVSYVPPEKLNRITRENHQGVVAQISPISFQSYQSLIDSVMEKSASPLFILLDQLTDVRNFGAIIRTAECAGANGIIVQKKGGAPVTADTIKTSAGAVFKVPIAKAVHLKDVIYYLQASGVAIVAASEKSDDSIYDLDLSGPLAIIMGAEDSGIHRSLLQLTDHQAKLPMMGEIGSLNVSVACGVFLYEVLRQRMVSGV